MLVPRNLVRTTQLARPVLQTEITSVCVFPGLLDMTVKKVLINCIAMSGLIQPSNENFDLSYNVPPCIRLARGKFKLTNQDSAGRKKFSVLT